MDLVERINMLCKQKNVTIAEVERKSGISNGQIRRWSNSSPKLENVKRVAKFFNVSLDYLTGFNEEELGEMEAQEIFKKLANEFELAGFSIYSQFENHLEYVHIEYEYHGTVEKMLFQDFIERGKYTLEELKEKYLDSDDVQTIAAHHDGEEWTAEELEEIERFKEFVKAKRKQE